MKIFKDYHIHSLLPNSHHAKDTPEDIVKEAIKKGLSEIAISNHGPGHSFYGIKKEYIKNLRTQIDELNKKYPQINILLGVEANILSLDGETDICEEIIENCDVILCGYHHGVNYSTFKDFFNLCFLSILAKKLKIGIESAKKRNTAAIVQAMEKYKFNILTHPGDKIPVNIKEIAKAAQKHNIILEINNSHTHLNIDELKICKNYDVKYIIGSDSHKKESIGGFENSLQRAKAADINLEKITNFEM